jgi:hypothetical protein
MKEFINAEITGTETQYLKNIPYRSSHPIRTFLFELSVIAAIAVVVGSVLWWSWNR